APAVRPSIRAHDGASRRRLWRRIVPRFRSVHDVIDFEAHAERIARDGYTILEDVIEPELRCALLAELERLEHDYEIVPSKNSSEGHPPVRIYTLLGPGRLFEQIPAHPNVLPLVERVPAPGCLVSSLSSISIAPGERAQPIHADDQLLPIP